MSLVTVAAAVAEEVGLTAPSSIALSQDKTAKQLLRLINRAGLGLAKKNWTVLQREHVFETEADIASYALPSDFERLLDGSAWDRVLYAQLRGPKNSREWQQSKSGSMVSTLRPRFRIMAENRVNKFILDPTPTAVGSLVFEYASTQWVRTVGNDEGRALYQSDTDIALISEELIELEAIWRLLNRKGFAYAEEKLEADKAIDRAFAEDGGAAVLNMGSSRGSVLTLPSFGEGDFTL